MSERRGDYCGLQREHDAALYPPITRYDVSILSNRETKRVAVWTTITCFPPDWQIEAIPARTRAAIHSLVWSKRS